jgi:cytoskeleton protein RodZ
VLLAGGAAFLLVTAVLSARLFRESPQAARAAPAESRAASPAPAAQPRPPVPAGKLRVELRTLRPVWARAFVDGRKAFERELPAGQRVPLQATRVIVVRAGDAGAIRLAVDGKDQGPLGPDGAPVTRLVTASAR